MTIPAQVLKAGEEADATIAAMSGQAQDGTVSAPAQTLQQSQAHAPAGAQAEQRPGSQAAQQQAQTQAPPDLSKVTDINQLRQMIVDGQHRYESLQGIVRTNADQARQRARALEEQNDTLRLLAKQQADTGQRAQESTGGQQAAPDLLAGIPEDVVSDLGEDALRSIIEAARASAKSDYEQRLQGVSQQMAQQTQASFLARVKAQVPNVEALNTNQDFLVWAGQRNVPYGPTRLDILQAAEKRGDAETVAAVFKAFTPAYHVPHTPSLGEQVVPQNNVGQQHLQQHGVTHGKAYTIEQWTAEMNRITKGEVKGEAAAQLELELDRAVNEGRVQNTFIQPPGQSMPLGPQPGMGG